MQNMCNTMITWGNITIIDLILDLLNVHHHITMMNLIFILASINVIVVTARDVRQIFISVNNFNNLLHCKPQFMPQFGNSLCYFCFGWLFLFWTKASNFFIYAFSTVSFKFWRRSLAFSCLAWAVLIRSTLSCSWVRCPFFLITTLYPFSL